MRRVERTAAIIVASITAAVIVSGVGLLKKHARYITMKASSIFGNDEENGTDSGNKSV